MVLYFSNVYKTAKFLCTVEASYLSATEKSICDTGSRDSAKRKAYQRN